MSQVYQGLPIFSQSRVQELHQAFIERTSDISGIFIMLAVLALCLLLALAMYWYYLAKQKSSLNSDVQLFHELARAYRLTYFQRRFLRNLATVRGLSNPCFLFIDPSLWVMDDELQKGLDGNLQRERFGMLRRLLFEIER